MCLQLMEHVNLCTMIMLANDRRPQYCERSRFQGNVNIEIDFAVCTKNGFPFPQAYNTKVLWFSCISAVNSLVFDKGINCFPSNPLTNYFANMQPHAPCSSKKQLLKRRFGKWIIPTFQFVCVFFVPVLQRLIHQSTTRLIFGPCIIYPKSIHCTSA